MSAYDPKGTHVPEHGERVPADPANFLRDFFLANGGIVADETLTYLVARHSFTYGYSLGEAWLDLRAEGYVTHEDGQWVWPMQVAYAKELKQ